MIQLLKQPLEGRLEHPEELDEAVGLFLHNTVVRQGFQITQLQITEVVSFNGRHQLGHQFTDTGITLGNHDGFPVFLVHSQFAGIHHGCDDADSIAHAIFLI